MKKSIIVIIEAKSKKQDPRQRIKKVSRGYAFNYLIPRKIAKVATAKKLKHLDMLYQKMSKSKDLTDNQNTKIKRGLENIGVIRIRKTCSPNKLIFGSISVQDIALKIFQLTGQKVDKQRIVIANSKQLGKYKVKIIISDNLQVSLNLHIIPKTV